MPDAQSRRPRLTPMQWRVFALSCGASFLLYFHRYSWNIVRPYVQSDFDLSNKQAEFLFSLFYWSYAVGQIPSGVVIDRFGARRFLSIIIVAWSVALAAIGQSASTVLIGANRLLFGMGQAGCYPALTKVSGSWFEPARRTVLQGWIATAAGRSGGALAQIVLGTVLMGRWGISWQSALAFLGIVGIAYGVLFWCFYRNPEPGKANTAPGTPASPKATLPWGRAWRNGSLRVFTVQQFLDAGSDLAFVSLIGTYFLRSRGFDIAQTGLLASLPLWGGALGGIAGGWLNDRAIARTGSRRWARSGVGFTGKIIGGFLLALVVGQSSGLTAALLLCAAKFFSDWSQPTVWGTCTDLGGRFSATVFSIINTAGTIGGVLMPIVFGHLLDLFTTSTRVADTVVSFTNWEPLFILLTAMYVASGVCWLGIDCTQTIGESD